MKKENSFGQLAVRQLGNKVRMPIRFAPCNDCLGEQNRDKTTRLSCLLPSLQIGVHAGRWRKKAVQTRHLLGLRRLSGILLLQQRAKRNPVTAYPDE